MGVADKEDVKRIILVVSALFCGVLAYFSFSTFWMPSTTFVYPRNILLALAPAAVVATFPFRIKVTPLIVTAASFLFASLIRNWMSVNELLFMPVITVSKMAMYSLVAVLFVFILTLIRKSGYEKLTVALAMCCLIICFCAQAGQLISIATANSNPANPEYESFTDKDLRDYQFDGFIYAQTINNMRAGIPYYDALREAMSRDARFNYTVDKPFKTIFHARQPFNAVLFSITPGQTMIGVYLFYVLFSFIVALASYFFVRRFCAAPFALLAFCLIGNYFLLIAGAFYLPFLWLFGEVWAGGFVVLALCALVYERPWLSAFFLLFACMSREFAYALIVIWALVWIVSDKDRKRRDWLPFLAACSMPIIAYGAHFYITPMVQNAAQGTQGSLSTWLNGSIQSYVAVLTGWPVGMYVAYASLTWMVPLVALLATGAIRPRRFRYPFMLMIIGYILFYLLIGTYPFFSTQWAMFGLPLFMTLACVVGAYLLPTGINRKSILNRDVESVIVLLPAYNEEKSIGDLIIEIREVLDRLRIPSKIIVMDDGSIDKTAEIAQRALGDGYGEVIRNEKNLGLGGNISRGLRLATEHTKDTDVIITLDADLTQSPRYIPEMIERYRTGADIVIASRYQPGSKVNGLSPFRHFMTLGARTMLTLLFPIPNVRDYSCGYRLYSAKHIQREFAALEDSFIRQNGFACMVEILCKSRRDVIVEEIPFTLEYGRKRQGSSMNVGKTVLQYFTVVFDVLRSDLFFKESKEGIS